MAIIAPFRGLRFNAEKIANLEDVVTPPYDVIDQKTQASFLARNPYNMIKLDISKNPGPVAESTDRYTQAKNYFDTWQNEGVLIQDDTPAIYLYEIEYSLASGKKFTRKGLVCLIQLAEFSEGIVKPHEETFGSVTEDRLRLMDTCEAQFSQIFSLYSDEQGEIIRLLGSCKPAQPICDVKDAGGARHMLWPVTDDEILKKVQLFFKGKSVYIADGHHRYTTALNYRRLVQERTGSVDENAACNYTMMYLCPMEDPGLSVLPTHRLLHLPVDNCLQRMADQECSLDRIVDILQEAFDIEELQGGSRETLLFKVMSRMDENLNSGATMFGLYHAGEDRVLLLRLKDDAMQTILGIGRPPALRELDVVVLSDLIIDHFLGLDHQRIENDNLISYYSDPDEALDDAVKDSVAGEKGTPLLFLMNNTKVEQVARVADAGLIMPHKSTFFYPKVLTGLLLCKFEDVTT